MSISYTPLDALLPPTQAQDHIVILGGSFDPPHESHIAMANVLAHSRSYQQVWILPCADHPFAKKLKAFPHRFAMCKLAFGDISHTHIVPLENYIEKPNFTVKTLEAIYTLRPNIKISLAMGADVYADLPRWNEAHKLSSLCNIIVFKREGHLLAPADSLKPTPSIKILDETVGPHSSTQIRNAQQPEGQDATSLAVKAYITHHHLYT